MANPFRFRIFWGEFRTDGTSCRPHFGFRFRFSILAEAVRFELTIPCGMPSFQGGGINHYPTPPFFLYCAIMRFFSRFYRSQTFVDISALTRSWIGGWVENIRSIHPPAPPDFPPACAGRPYGSLIKRCAVARFAPFIGAV